MLIKRYLITGVALMALVAGFAMKNAAAEEGTGIAPQQAITIAGKKPAVFDHQKHLALGMQCAVCHHNSDHEGLTAEAIKGLPNSKSLQCANCHNENFANAELQKRKDVFHGRCRECHKAGYNGKKGPTKCNDCHIKTKRKLEGC